MSDQTQSDATVARPLGLLRTKLFIPRTHPDVIARPQLIQILNEVFERKVAIISAPAGSGKSTLLSSWVDSFGEQTSLLEDSTSSAQDNHLAGQKPCFAWVSLDERENDPVRFWTYCIAALQTLQPETGVTTLAMLQELQHTPVENN